ncbi:MAG TPA: hypothetical protein DEH78_27640 [Solibacterales bacterium]|nr:hypothetical protein [Bryobacterales bacterium]
MTPTPEAPAAAGRRSALFAAAASLLLILLWLSLTVHFNYGGNWTGLFCTGSLLRQPPALASTTFTFANSYGYDGQFYRYVAHDPFFRHGYAAHIDNPRFRYRRGFTSLAAWALAFGRAQWIDAAYIAVIMLSAALGVYWSARYLLWRGAHPAWSLLFLILPSTVTSVDRMLTDGALGALFAAFVYYVARNCWHRAAAAAGLAFLTRETGLILVAGLAAYWLLKRDFARAAGASAAVLPGIAWYAFVQVNTVDAPVPGAIAVPLSAWLTAITTALPDALPPLQAAILKASYVTGLLGLAGTVLLAVLWSRTRSLGAVEISIYLFALMTALLGPVVMRDPYAYGRAASPLLLFLMLEASAARVYGALLPPVVLSCAVGVLLSGQVAVVAKRLLGIAAQAGP